MVSASPVIRLQLLESRWFFANTCVVESLKARRVKEVEDVFRNEELVLVSRSWRVKEDWFPIFP